MKVNIEDLKRAVDVVGDAGGPMAEIIAQFTLDLVITAPLCGPMAPEAARRLLHLRLARHRVTEYPISGTVH